MADTDTSADKQLPSSAGAAAADMPPSKLASAAAAAAAAAAATVTVDPARASTLHAALSSVLTRVHAASARRQPSGSNPPPHPRVVAVSKLKPAADILALHTATILPRSAGAAPAQEHFGENYVQELLEKARVLPRSIKWHMIGGLQSNKCRELARQVGNLWAVESVDSVKKAGLLEKGRAEYERGRSEADGVGGQHETEKLRIFVQVNTSGEASKAGVAPDGDELGQLCRYIREQCPHLHLQGLMTIGAIARSRAAASSSGNEDFESLKRARDRVAAELALDPGSLELSMGMSDDFEAAILQGSDEVRIGTTIFGQRPPKVPQQQQQQQQPKEP